MKDGVLSAPEDAKLPEIRSYALPAVMTMIGLSRKQAYLKKVGSEYYGRSEKPWRRMLNVHRNDPIPRVLVQQTSPFTLRPLQELVKDILTEELNQPANEKFRKDWKGFENEAAVVETWIR